MTTEQPTRQERIAEQTEVRRALLRNGYVPLANKSKLCVLKNWPRLEVTEAVIDGWADTGYQATGVRIEGDLVALDFDIDDVAALDAIWDAMPDDLFDAVDRMPVRKGGGDKVCLFCRVGGGGRAENIWSKAFYHPDQAGEADASTHRLEIFMGGGSSGRQVGVYGAHSIEGGVVAKEYSWVGGRGLVDVPFEDLPVLTVGQLEALADVVSSVLFGLGWVYEVSSLDGRVGGAREYVLTDDMQFCVHGGGGDVVDLAGLEDLCAGAEGVRVSMGWREKGAVNTTRGLVSLNPADDRVQIWDTMTGVLYRPVDVGLAGKVAALGEKLVGCGAAGEGEGAGLSRLERLAASVPADRRVFGQSAEAEGGGGGPTEEDIHAHRKGVVEGLLDRYAYWSDGKGFVVDVFRGPEAAMTVGSFGAKMEPWSWIEYGPRGGEKEINPADLWRKDARRLDVGGYRFLPWSRERLVKIGADVFINTWERPAWWDGVGNADSHSLAVEAFKLFLEHLIPDEGERSWFVQWLAAKVQKPWLPNCGVIMVAERQGTGRGTLFDVLRGVFGARHVRNVGSGQLLGHGSQAQYNDWIADSLLVTCDEVLTGDDSGGAMAWKRREAYERLKGLVDPRARDIQIVRKGLPNTPGEVFASFLLATNNVNALPLSPDDRRIAVVTNSSVPLVQRREIMERLAPWRTDVGFDGHMGAAVYAWLSEVAVGWESVREAPAWMSGRARMLAANEGDLESVLDSVLQEVPGDYILAGHLRERIGKALEAAGLDHEIKAWWVRASDMLGRLNSFGWRRRDGRCKFQPRSMGNQVSVVFYRDEPGRLEAWDNATPEQRVEMWSKSKDLNHKLSAIHTKMQERGLRVEK